MGFYTMFYSGFVLIFQRNKLPPSSGWLNLFQVAVFALKKGPASSFQVSDKTSELDSVKTWKATYAHLIIQVTYSEYF
jgi:hypothetical protein